MIKNDFDFNRYVLYLKKYHFIYWLALRHHKTHKNKNLDFNKYKFLKAIYLDDSKYIIIIKSTQCGITEYLIARSIGKAIQGKSVFYVLPTYQLVARVNRNRVDKAINNTLYYKNLEKLIKETNERKRSDSMTLRDIGNGTIAYVGSNSTAGFTEYPADEVIIDEMNECDQEKIIMAWERMSASEDRTEIKVANPTVEGFGIDNEWANSNQMEWNIKHDCGKYIVFDWFEQAVREVDEGTYVIRDDKWEWNSNRDIHLICQHCGKPINRENDGQWIHTVENERRGYHINKMFSSNVSIVEMLKRFNDGLSNPKELQRFYNADLGMSFTAKGSKIDASMLDAIKENYISAIPSFGIMGIDVGNVLNIIIGDFLPDRRIKICFIGEVKADVKEVKRLAIKYNVRIGVIDAFPEQYFVSKLKGAMKNIFACYYQESKREPVDQYRNIVVPRTASMDGVMEDITLKNIILPRNAKGISKFYDQMQASTRIFDEKVNRGKGAYVWVHSKPDHFHHSMVCLNIAKKLIIAMKKK